LLRDSNVVVVVVVVVVIIIIVVVVVIVVIIIIIIIVVVVIVVIIIIINSCYPLGDIGRQQITAIWSYFRPSNDAKLGPMLGSQALPVTNQDKVVRGRGVTPLKKSLVYLDRLVVPCKGSLPGYGEVLNGNVGRGGDLR
jgi:hypothetical protein